MSPQARYPRAEPRPDRRLLATLASRAERLGSRDPESAAQEALKRSLQNPESHAAIEYYFADELAGAEEPAWPLDRLFAWLHAVLHYVVREEQARAGFRRELPLTPDSPGREPADPADPAPNPLEALIQSERRRILAVCLPSLDPDHRTVVEMRMKGLAYSDIAARLRVNPNTVATWVARGIRALAQCVRRRGALNRGVPHA